MEISRRMNSGGCEKRKWNILNLETAMRSGLGISVFPEISRMPGRTENKYAVSFC
jgi:hypothetical protein